MSSPSKKDELAPGASAQQLHHRVDDAHIENRGVLEAPLRNDLPDGAPGLAAPVGEHHLLEVCQVVLQKPVRPAVVAVHRPPLPEAFQLRSAPWTGTACGSQATSSTTTL